MMMMMIDELSCKNWT